MMESFGDLSTQDPELRLRQRLLGELTPPFLYELTQTLSAIAIEASAVTRWMEVEPSARIEAMAAERRIQAHVSRASGLIDGVLAFSVADAAELVLRNTLYATGMDVKTDLDPSVPRVRAHKGRVQHALFELALQCARMLPEGSATGRVEIATDATGEDPTLRIRAPRSNGPDSGPFFETVRDMIEKGGGRLTDSSSGSCSYDISLVAAARTEQRKPPLGACERSPNGSCGSPS
jgi:hypothetical protein